MTNLVTDIEGTAAETPDATALGLPDGELTYGDLWSRTGRFARALADAGLDPGDRVGLYLPNVEAYVTAFLGTLRAGGIVVPTPDAEVTPAGIREYCLEKLAAYKHPREVEFVEELPRTTTGKVQKFELRETE